MVSPFTLSIIIVKPNDLLDLFEHDLSDKESVVYAEMGRVLVQVFLGFLRWERLFFVHIGLHLLVRLFYTDVLLPSLLNVLLGHCLFFE